MKPDVSCASAPTTSPPMATPSADHPLAVFSTRSFSDPVGKTVPKLATSQEKPKEKVSPTVAEIVYSAW